MNLTETLKTRSNNQCELCASTNTLEIYEVPPNSSQSEHDSLYICKKCADQLNKKEELDEKHWKCLIDSMWSETPAVKVMAWHMLNRLQHESWAMEQLDMLYLDDETLVWAKAGYEEDSELSIHQDCNGNTLQTGDSVVLIKSLDVKGSSVNAKMGTAVKNIRLVEDNTAYIEGKIDGQMIVILTKYVRKSN